MEIKTKFDFEDFDKIKKYISPNYLFVHILAAVVIIFCVLTNHVLIGFIIGFIGVIIMEGMFIVVSRKNTEILRERLKQSLNGKDKLELVIRFDESDFTSHSLNTGSKLTVPYTEIKKIIISDKYSFLITNANTFLIIETSQVLDNKLDEFLLSKNPNIRIR